MANGTFLSTPSTLDTPGASTSLLDQLSLPPVLATLLVVFLAYRHFTAPKGKLPPGPKQLPIVGNLWDLPKKRPWTKMEEWTREYGPIYTLKLGKNTVLVVGRASVALELLDKRSATYSSRPRLIMTSELVSRGLRMTFMPYGDLWRRERRLLHQLTSSTASAGYEHIQEMESAQLVRDMIRNPKNFWGHAQRYAGSTIMQIAFNKRAPTPNDHAITEMRKVNEAMTKTAVPGRYLVDSLPILNYLPRALAPFKREADEIFETTLKLFKSHFDSVRTNLQQGKDSDCFAKNIIDLQSKYQLKDEQAIFLGGAMYGAGSDTTADGISTFVLTCVAHQDKIKLAQEELDRVVGRSRLPEFHDSDELVYCNAIIRETMRWRTIIAGGLAHSTTEDDVYEGYFIPKGTSILANLWAIHNDPEVYPEPEKFLPERFIENGKLVGTKYSDRGHHGFGFGRRICPGQFIAERSLFIVFTRLMWACNITNATDPATGKPIPVDVDAYSEGFSSHPLTFQCDIKPRGDWVKEVVDEATSGLA